jgi:hypothetical protein
MTMTTSTTLKDLVDIHGLNATDISHMDVKDNKLVKVTLKNGDWVDILPDNKTTKYHTNNDVIYKPLTKDLHDIREKGIRKRELKQKID